jgi:hypothetical protein
MGAGEADRPVWFVGDLGDPWVASLGEALPAGTRRIAAEGGLPEDWERAGGGPEPPRVVVLHRPLLTTTDARRLARFRSAVPPESRPKVVLCVGPHVRYADLERWSALGLVDAVVPEATARDTIARHLDDVPDAGDGPPAPRPAGTRPRVTVVSALYELRRTLAEACEALGYPAAPARDWSEAAAGGPAVWDVPVLEPDWPRDVARRSRQGPLVVLLGFADRALVGQARASGASACLELPYDWLDLGHVLDRVTAPRAEPPHAVPPPPSGRRHAARARARAKAQGGGDAGRAPVAGPGRGA